MRLIDADALIQVLCVNMDTGQQFDRATHCVDEMPTVDAIPIKWIEEYYGDDPAIYADRMIDAWNGDPNGFNDETVQALKDTTERKNLSKVYETLDDMYADMDVSEWHEYIYRVRETADGVESDRMGELIRCKDCKHSEPWYRDRRRCFLWNENGIDVFDDGYCNYGKIKAEREEE